MKKAILAVALASAMFSATAQAGSDEAIMFEFGFGFGPSGTVTKTKEQMANKYNNKFCYHRPSSRMTYMAIRYKYERAEAHVARWFNDSDQPHCERSSWAAGLGYVLDTQDIEADGVDDVYATYTPGLAFTWGEEHDFNVEDNTNTNWRLKDNWQMYNRVAIGTGDKDYMGEVAVVRYGNPIGDFERTGENFVTLTLGARDFDSERDNTSATGDQGLTVIINDNREEIALDPAPETPPTEAATNENLF